MFKKYFIFLGIKRKMSLPLVLPMMLSDPSSLSLSTITDRLQEEPNPSLLMEIPQDIFINVIAKYLPIETLQELGKDNKQLRSIYLEMVLEDPNVWKIVIDSSDLELLRFIPDKPSLGELESLFEDCLVEEAELLYTLIQRCDKEEIKNLTLIVISCCPENGALLVQKIAEKPELLDFFLPYVDQMPSLYDAEYHEDTINVFILIRDKLGYIPKSIFNNYIGAIIGDCYSKHYRDRTGDRISTLLANPNSNINNAMKLFANVR